MYGARDHLLARARLTRDEDCGLNLRDRFNHLVDGLHLLRVADDLVESAALALRALKGAVLLKQPEPFERLLDDELHLVHVEGLLYEVVGPELERLARRLDRGEGRHHHDARVGQELAHAPQKLDAVHVGHLHVRDDEVGGLLLQQFERFRAALGRPHRMVRAPEDVRQKLPHPRLVINNQKVRHSLCC